MPNNINVVITNPPNGEFIKEALLKGTNSHTGFSFIKFTGYATDRDGSAITGNNLKWAITGASDGIGEQYLAKIDLSAGTFDSSLNASKYIVKLTATGKDGTQVSTSINLYYSNVVIQ